MPSRKLMIAAGRSQSVRRDWPSRPCRGVGDGIPLSAKCSIKFRKYGKSSGATRFSYNVRMYWPVSVCSSSNVPIAPPERLNPSHKKPTISSLTSTLQPGSEELLNKRNELLDLEQALAERELEFSTIKSEIHIFEKQYQHTVGIKHQELDEVRAQVMELAVRFYPRSDEFRNKAKNARDQAKKSAGEYQEIAEDSEPEQKFMPTEELKKLFRDVAKKIHPDLAGDESEQERCHLLMAKLNQAYQCMDEEAIQSVLLDWESGQPEKEELPVGAQLVRLLKKISRGKKRMQKILRDQEELELSEMYILMQKSEGLKVSGVDLLEELAGKVEEKILKAKSRIRDLASDIH